MTSSVTSHTATLHLLFLDYFHGFIPCTMTELAPHLEKPQELMEKCYFILVWGPCPAVLRAGSWYCSQGLHLAGLKRTTVLKIEPCLAICNASAYSPSYLSLVENFKATPLSSMLNITLDVTLMNRGPEQTGSPLSEFSRLTGYRKGCSPVFIF